MTPIRLALLTLVAALALARPAHALEDADTEIAKKHFKQGSQYYTAGKYDEALAEFLEGRLVKPLPAFDYNIAKCYDRLERYGDAIKAYQSYLDGGAKAEDVAPVRARIAELRIREEAREHILKNAHEGTTEEPPPTATAPPATLEPPSLAPPKPQPAPVAPSPPGNETSTVARYKWGIALTAVAAAFVIAGGVSIGIAAGRYSDAQTTCGHACSDATLSDIQVPANVGYTCLGLAGAAAIGAVVAFVLERPSMAPPRHALLRLAPSASGLAIQF